MGTASAAPKDFLHNFHQGVLCVVIAALVCSHIDSLYPGITLKDLDSVLSKDIYKHYKHWCKGRGKHVTPCSHRFSAARFGKEKWPTYPELGSIYKAAVVKTMLFWCNDFLKEQVGHVMGADQRFHCIFGFAKFQYLMDIHGPFFEPSVTAEVVKYARAGLLFYQELAALDRSRADDHRFYKLIPKCHSLYEMTIYTENTNRNPRYLESINTFCWSALVSSLFWNQYFFVQTTLGSSQVLVCLPRFFQGQASLELRFEHCYQDEDLMKEVGRIASRTHPATMDSVTLHRYRALLELCVD